MAQAPSHAVVCNQKLAGTQLEALSERWCCPNIPPGLQEAMTQHAVLLTGCRYPAPCPAKTQRPVSNHMYDTGHTASLQTLGRPCLQATDAWKSPPAATKGARATTCRDQLTCLCCQALLGRLQGPDEHSTLPQATFHRAPAGHHCPEAPPAGTAPPMPAWPRPLVCMSRWPPCSSSPARGAER